MKLPVWAAGDSEGISTYPLALVGSGWKLLHIFDPGSFIRGLCGVVAGGHVEYLGERRVKVCPACRRVAEREN